MLVVLQTMMKDFLGNEYGPGDLVIYAAASGRSITMVIGRVVKVNERTEIDYSRPVGGGKRGYHRMPVTDRDGKQLVSVNIQPLNSSRWQQHDPRTYYVDKRTGEKIDRYKHVKEAAYNTLNSTGERLPDNCSVWTLYRKRERSVTDRNWGYSDTESYKNPDYVPSELRTYHATVFEDYVEERDEGPKPVTITVTENIVKWSGELPDA